MNRFGLGLGNGSCSQGATCGSGAGLGLGGRLAGHIHDKGTPDCNGAEPKLSGEPLCTGYRFANIEPRNYNRQATIVDPISGFVKGPQKGEPKTTVSANSIVLAKMEQPAASNVTAKPAIPSPAVVPAAKPIMATPKWNTKSPSEGRSLSTPFSHQ